jgi:hypothetical protein
MSTTPKKCKDYQNIPDDWCKTTVGDHEVDVKDCCIKGPSDDPKGCDCCYDTWNDELKDKQKQWGQLSEEASQAQDKLTFSKVKRDGFKKWRDDLLLIDEYSADVCHQFDLIISQVQKICKSTKHTVKASRILLCMVRDFYMQLDKIRIKYDRLQSCIKDHMSATILVPGTGFMKCLEAYNEKLKALLDTKEDIIRQLMDIIKMANLVHEDACTPYGLSCILEEWQCRLNCSGKAIEEGQPAEIEAGCDPKYDKCAIVPQLTFPIRKVKVENGVKEYYFVDQYAKWVDCMYKKAENEAGDDMADLLEANKKKEAMSACISSLKDAVTVTNPKDRCS